MAIARTLTKKAPESKSGRSRKGSVSKLQISAPVELISTTNNISYTSPSLRSYQQSQGMMGGISPSGSSLKSPLSRSSTSSSSESSPDSDIRTSAQFFLPNMADDSILSPKSPHRNGFVFSGPGSPMLPQSSQPIPPMPPIPPMSSSRSSTSSMGRTKSVSSQRSSHHRRAQPSYSASNNPFAAELHKVSEIAESFGILGGLDYEEEEYMRQRGLRRFGVSDYIEALGLVAEAEVESDDGYSGGWI